MVILTGVGGGFNDLASIFPPILGEWSILNEHIVLGWVAQPWPTVHWGELNKKLQGAKNRFNVKEFQGCRFVP